MRPNSIILISCIIMNTALFSKDIYLPSLPSIITDMHISTTWAGASITLFLLGMAISQIIFGALSDMKGRKFILIWGLVICCLGNIFSCICHSANSFLFWRFVTGFGAGSCPVITRAIASDLFKEADLTKAISYLSMCTVISPLLAPTIGGVLQDNYGWHASFVFLSFFSFISLAIVCFFLQESRSKKLVTQLNLTQLKKNSLDVIKNKFFLVYSLLSVIGFAPSISYCLISPFIFQQTLGLSATQNGLLYIYIALSYFLGAFLANKLAGKISDETLILYGLNLSCLGGLCMLITYYLFDCNVYTISLPMFVNVVGCGLITPAANKQSLALFQNIAGMTAALLGSIRMIGGFVIGLILPLFNLSSQLTLAISLIIFAIMGYLLIQFQSNDMKEEVKTRLCVT